MPPPLGGLAPAMRCELAGDARPARATRPRRCRRPSPASSCRPTRRSSPGRARSRRVAGELDRFADVESRGAATVYRLIAGQRRPGPAGRAVHREILRSWETQPLGRPPTGRVLVADVGRRYGRLRVGAAASFLRCDDQALLAELVRHRKLAKLELRSAGTHGGGFVRRPRDADGGVARRGFLPAEEDAARRPRGPAPDHAAHLGPAVVACWPGRADRPAGTVPERRTGHASGAASQRRSRALVRRSRGRGGRASAACRGDRHPMEQTRLPLAGDRARPGPPGPPARRRHPRRSDPSRRRRGAGATTSTGRPSRPGSR